MNRTIRSAGVVALAALTGFTLAGCGGSSSSGKIKIIGDSAAPSGDGARPDGMGGGMGVTGKATEVGSSQLTVAASEPASGDWTVKYSSTTTFTKQKTVTKSDVTVGSCVVVSSASDASAGSGSASSSSPTAITAASVAVSKSTNGSCSRGFGNGTRPSGSMPSGAMPSGTMPAGGLRGGRGVFGTVTSVNDTGFVVTPEHSPEVASASESPVVVSVTGTTSYTAEASASVADVAVGECVTARGTTSGTTVTATTVSLRAADSDGSCRYGMTGSPSNG